MEGQRASIRSRRCKGKKYGVWIFGNEFEQQAALVKAGLDPKKDVRLVKQNFDMVAFLKREIDAASAMTYNELAQVLETKNPKTGKLYQLSDLNVFKMSDLGVGMLQDAVFVKGDWIADKANQATAVKFLQASFKGWAYCRDHFKECVDIVLAQGTALPRGHQSWQMNEVNALIWPNRLGIGVMDPVAWKTTADIAYRFKVIKKPATRASVPHGPRQAGGRQSQEAGCRRLRQELEEVRRDPHGRRKVGMAYQRPRALGPGTRGEEALMSVLIKGGRVVTAADSYVADVVVEGERIAAVGDGADVAADTVIDASGKLVLPGAVDPHTHLDMPFGGTTTIDDVLSGHTAAVFGGTTCHVDFCIQGKGQSFADALADWQAKREGKAIIDMGYHIAVTDLSEPGRLEELATLPDQGVTSYKLFMAYKGALQVDDETLFRTMEVAAKTGALVMVHAENGDAIDVLVKEALAAGNTAPHFHALTRPPEMEGEATNRAIQLARVAGCALYIVHVSCREAVEPIALAREKGWAVWGETCTQYFFVDTTFLERPDFEGAKYVYTPPPRSKANQDVLWNAVRTDVLSAISTDHCAFLWDGQKTLGSDDFSKIPNGGPGLENRLHMIHHFGVGEGRITLNRMVELLSTNPAKLFGLYPRKGTIAPGSDADSSSSTRTGRS